MSLVRFRGHEGHRPSRGNRDHHPDERRAARNDDRIPQEAHVVRTFLHHSVVFERPVEEQEQRRVIDRLCLGLETCEDRPEDREEDQDANAPGKHRVDRLAAGGDGT
jgi:hypothetical protein